MSDPGSPDNPLLVAVVGSGPSGFYAAEALLKSELEVRISMVERLPSPYGLVRSGVAPDHPKLKQAIKVYAGIAASPGFTFLGNVTVGSDVSIEELRATHHAVILCCGAESDRRLGIPGEDLPGSHTATEFVGWYNGHPDYRDREFDLDAETAVIIGQGNVAADVARILAKTADELCHTDIAEHALEALSRSRIRDIYVIGRRGPAQAKFTSKELREFGDLAEARPVLDPAELELNPASQAELDDKTNAGSRKVYEIFKEFAERAPDDRRRRVHFTFRKSPAELLGDDRLTRVMLEANQLSGEAFSQSARGTGVQTELQCGILFRSIGYRGVAMPGVPFDEKRGVFANSGGRIVEAGSAVPGMYVAGWIKRGPTGIIGTNRADSVATVAALLEDVRNPGHDSGKTGAPGLRSLLDERRVRHISFDDWMKIDRSEVDRGSPKQKPREKFTRVAEMLAVLD